MLDFKVNFPEDEHKHEHETVEVEVFSILDDDEKERFYKELGVVELEGEECLLCHEVFLDESFEKIVDEKEEVHVFKKITINGEVYLEYVNDYDLAKRAFDFWKKEGET